MRGCLCAPFTFAPWRAGCSRRYRRANLPLSVAFPLTDGRARRARCALVAVASRLGALALPLGGGALVAFALAPWRAGASGRARPAHFYPCIHLAPWRADSYAPPQARTYCRCSCHPPCAGVLAHEHTSQAVVFCAWRGVGQGRFCCCRCCCCCFYLVLCSRLGALDPHAAPGVPICSVALPLF